MVVGETSVGFVEEADHITAEHLEESLCSWSGSPVSAVAYYLEFFGEGQDEV